MRYFYKPVLITEWVDREIKERRRLPFNTEKFRSLIAELEVQTKILLEESFDRFKTWLDRLSPEKLLAFTFIIPKIQNMMAVQYLVHKLNLFSKRDMRVFDYALHSTYHNNVFDETWDIAKEAYSERKESITLGWSKDKILLWDLLMEDGRPISKQIHQYASRYEFDKLIEFLMVEKGHLFYQDLLFNMFVNGTTSLYKAYQTEFIEYFRRADNTKRQMLAEGFIRSQSCYEVTDISDEIFSKLQTHVKSPMKWFDVRQKEKEEFHSWYMSKELFDFFGENREGGERFKYWKKYSRRIQRLIHLPHDATIFMYFSDVVIIEKMTGGAIYIYDRSWFDDKFDVKVSIYEQYYKPNRPVPGPYKINRNAFMDTTLSHDEGRIKHYSGWQEDVDKYLRNKLGWDV
ncbi:hypothetical protein J7I80_11575 [Bacillus sp. ISL-41]|uniref:hypothetical protein n=1 Tax=Bacillus sp. ISL-41 TaxID=2819127 RepID=UPI001BE9EF25|nr:hypothetical protein [Bacillus sp. ISL-41]MBT2642868.1 hypothetical protein [Bacillus sp. ISL-41]